MGFLKFIPTITKLQLLIFWHKILFKPSLVQLVSFQFKQASKRFKCLSNMNKPRKCLSYFWCLCFSPSASCSNLLWWTWWRISEDLVNKSLYERDASLTALTMLDRHCVFQLNQNRSCERLLQRIQYLVWLVHAFPFFSLVPCFSFVSFDLWVVFFLVPIFPQFHQGPTFFVWVHVLFISTKFSMHSYLVHKSKTEKQLYYHKDWEVSIMLYYGQFG